MCVSSTALGTLPSFAYVIFTTLYEISLIVNAHFNRLTEAKYLVGVLTFCLREKITRKLPHVVERKLCPDSGGQGFGLNTAPGSLWTSEESIKLSRLQVPSMKCLHSMMSKIICKLETLSRSVSLSVK